MAFLEIFFILDNITLSGFLHDKLWQSLTLLWSSPCAVGASVIRLRRWSMHHVCFFLYSHAAPITTFVPCVKFTSCVMIDSFVFYYCWCNFCRKGYGSFAALFLFSNCFINVFHPTCGYYERRPSTQDLGYFQIMRITFNAFLGWRSSNLTFNANDLRQLVCTSVASQSGHLACRKLCARKRSRCECSSGIIVRSLTSCSLVQNDESMTCLARRVANTCIKAYLPSC